MKDIKELPQQDEFFLYSIDGDGPLIDIREVRNRELKFLVAVGGSRYSMTLNQFYMVMLRKPLDGEVKIKL